MPPKKRFRIRLTGDFFDSEGRPRFPELGLSVLYGAPHVEVTSFDDHRPQIDPDQVGDAQGVIVLTPKVTGATVSNADELLAIGRFGVGYESVDVEACTQAGVVAFITTGAVNRSVAEATVGWMIALTHHVRTKDRLVREGRWDDRSRYMGVELRDRTFGAVGLGGIAQQTIRLLSAFGMKQPLAYDPYASSDAVRALGVRLVSLDELLQQADFVSIHCPLTDQTRGLIGRRELRLMKPDAYLINTARGGIVDEDALYDVLQARSIAGAALDCFADEPVTRPHRLGELDNVVLAPHCIAWTTELFRDIGQAVSKGMLDLSFGCRPHGVLNPEVFDQPQFLNKWRRHQHRESV